MVEYGYREKPKTTSHRLEAGPVIIPSSRRRLIHGAALFVVRKQARRKNNKPGLLPAADLPGAPARLYSAGHRPITQPATAKWRPMEASAQWAVRRRRKRPEAVSAQRSVGPAPRGPQAYWANGTRAKAGTTSRGSSTQRTERRRAAETRRAYGRTAAKSRTRSGRFLARLCARRPGGEGLCRWRDGAEPKEAVPGDGRVGRAGRSRTRRRPRLPGRHAFTPGRREQPGGQAKAAEAEGVGLWRRKRRRTGGNRAGPAGGGVGRTGAEDAQGRDGPAAHSSEACRGPGRPSLARTEPLGWEQKF